MTKSALNLPNTKAILSGETITIYGDYDVDGITSTALMVSGSYSTKPPKKLSFWSMPGPLWVSG